MLVLRRPQIEALAGATLDRFVAKAVDQVARFFPAVHAELGRAEVEHGVRDALPHARRHGLETERDLLAYMMLVFYFGHDFDRELPWAQDILAAREPTPLRMGRLQSAALTHQDAASGYVPPRRGGARG